MGTECITVCLYSGMDKSKEELRWSAKALNSYEAPQFE